MTTDQPLFGEPEVSQPDTPKALISATHGIADWKVSQFRRALDATGTVEMVDRQELVEKLVGRVVPSLRDLGSSEAQDLLERLQRQSRAPARRQGSSWDERDEDTWIDRM
jgi:hypothetical protein